MPIALLGTGLLGTAIGQRLLSQQQPLQVWNRDPDRVQPLLALGARAAATPGQAVSQSDWVITVLSDGAATRSVLLDQVGAALAGCRVVQMGTIGPGESRELADAIQQRGGAYLEAPVLGSRAEALAGRLQIMAGGGDELFQQALPLLSLLGEEPQLMGPLGAGLETKLALNQLIASLTHAFSLSLHLVQAAGVDGERFMGLLRQSALYAPTFDKKLAKLLAHDYANPNFPTAHLRKDLRLFQEAAAAYGLDGSALEGLANLLERARGTPLDAMDYSSLHRLTESPQAPAAS
ncbi:MULTISPECIES: NAD(P)-dependent oxidoreductase [Aphanothece]|uniref:NAD(P)-dependent oxidoreductase n=1 Tax=Aphanothece TaxID=1121 RepID=UPI00398E9576